MSKAPRVMALSEIPATYGTEAIWLETHDTRPRIALFDHETGGCLMLYDILDGRKKWRKDLYGREWRCWNTVPDSVMLALEPWVPAEG